MANRENLTNLHARFTLKASEMIALVDLLNKASSGQRLTLHEHQQVEKFTDLFGLGSKRTHVQIPL